MSWLPRQRPSVGRPARSRRAIELDLRHEERVEVGLVHADRAAEHDEQVRLERIDVGEARDRDLEIANGVAAPREESARAFRDPRTARGAEREWTARWISRRGGRGMVRAMNDRVMTAQPLRGNSYAPLVSRLLSLVFVALGIGSAAAQPPPPPTPPAPYVIPAGHAREHPPRRRIAGAHRRDAHPRLLPQARRDLEAREHQGRRPHRRDRGVRPILHHDARRGRRSEGQGRHLRSAVHRAVRGRGVARVRREARQRRVPPRELQRRHVPAEPRRRVHRALLPRPEAGRRRHGGVEPQALRRAEARRHLS